MEQIFTYFSNEWVPATGLSPTVNIWLRDGTHKVTNGACRELAGGFYYYNFDAYSPDKQYLYLFDGTATLGDSDRYNSGANDLDAYTNKLSWGRTAAPMTNYFDKSLKEVKDIISQPKDNSDILNSIQEIKKLLNKPKKEQKQVDISKLLGTMEEKIIQSNAEITSGIKSHLTSENELIISQLSDSVKQIIELSNNLHNEKKWMISKMEEWLLSNIQETKKTGEDGIWNAVKTLESKMEEVLWSILETKLLEKVGDMFDVKVTYKWSKDKAIEELANDPFNQLLED